MANTYQPTTPTLAFSATRFQAAATGTQVVGTWIAAADSLLRLGGTVNPAATGTVTLAATYVDPVAGTLTALLAAGTQVPGSNPTGWALVDAQGVTPVVITVTPDAAGTVLVTASVEQLRAGA